MDPLGLVGEIKKKIYKITFFTQNSHMGIIDELYPDIEKIENAIFMKFSVDCITKTFAL